MKLFGFLPNLLGVANTSIMRTRGNRFYALFERDVPYQIHIDLHEKRIETVGRVGSQRMSGHSRFVDGKIVTIDYHLLRRSVSFLSLHPGFKMEKRREIPFRYFPLVHDFLVFNRMGKQCVFLLDAPFVIDLRRVFQKKIPIVLHPKRRTFIYLYEIGTGQVETYVCRDSFAVFHFSLTEETENGYDIYASLYEQLDFDELAIRGKYRRLHLDKRTREITVHKNPEIEWRFNLDFPVVFGEKWVVSRNFNVGKMCIDGFVVTEGLDIVGEIFFVDREILGEPQILSYKERGRGNKERGYKERGYKERGYKERGCLCFFNKKSDLYFLSLLPFRIGNKERNTQIFFLEEIRDFPIDEPLSLGFHSIFVPLE